MDQFSNSATMTSEQIECPVPYTSINPEWLNIYNHGSPLARNTTMLNGSSIEFGCSDNTMNMESGHLFNSFSDFEQHDSYPNLYSGNSNHPIITSTEQQTPSSTDMFVPSYTYPSPDPIDESIFYTNANIPFQTETNPISNNFPYSLTTDIFTSSNDKREEIDLSIYAPIFDSHQVFGFDDMMFDMSDLNHLSTIVHPSFSPPISSSPSSNLPTISTNKPNRIKRSSTQPPFYPSPQSTQLPYYPSQRSTQPPTFPSPKSTPEELLSDHPGCLSYDNILRVALYYSNQTIFHRLQRYDPESHTSASLVAHRVQKAVERLAEEFGLGEIYMSKNALSGHVALTKGKSAGGKLLLRHVYDLKRRANGVRAAVSGVRAKSMGQSEIRALSGVYWEQVTAAIQRITGDDGRVETKEEESLW